MLGKKVSDFIKLEDGNIGRKAAMVTGATLAASVLGMVLTAQSAQAVCHSDATWHTNCWPHSGGSTWHWNVWNHENISTPC